MSDSQDTVTLPVTSAEIERLLPHRYPFLLVDRVVEFEKNKRVLAYKNVTCNEPFFTGHFPGNPVMPGVLVVEALAQAGGLLTQLSRDPGVGEKHREARGEGLDLWRGYGHVTRP